MSTSPGRSGRWIAVAALLIGLCGALWLVMHVGFQPVLHSALSAGWGGLALLCAFGLANFAMLGAGWSLIVPPYQIRAMPIFLWGRAVRDSAGDALPFSAIGGMVIGARAVALCGISPALAVGSTIVDVTLELVAQLFFVLGGLVILAEWLPEAAAQTPLVHVAAIALAVGSMSALTFFILQRRGLGALERIAQRTMPGAVTHTRSLNGALNEIHAAPVRMFCNFLAHCAGWLSAAFGTWLTLLLIGTHISYAEAVAIESMLCAARSATVFVPGAIGIQEAGYAVMMPLFGVPAEVGLAVSLLKRSREILVAIPVVLSWQIVEAARLRYAAPDGANGSPGAS